MISECRYCHAIDLAKPHGGMPVSKNFIAIMRTLATLEEGESMAGTDLAAALDISPSTTSSLLRELQHHGLVQTEMFSKGRAGRAQRTWLTSLGRAWKDVPA